jgi:NADH:ubiquinone oxidoreductase subunit H
MLTFTGWGWAGWVSSLVINLLAIVVFIMAIMVLDILLVWVERKVVARFQDRLGRIGSARLVFSSLSRILSN